MTTIELRHLDYDNGTDKFDATILDDSGDALAGHYRENPIDSSLAGNIASRHKGGSLVIQTFEVVFVAFLQLFIAYFAEVAHHVALLGVVALVAGVLAYAVTVYRRGLISLVLPALLVVLMASALAPSRRAEASTTGGRTTLVAFVTSESLTLPDPVSMRRPGWLDPDGNGLDTRAEILLARCHVTSFRDTGAPTAGICLDGYTGLRIMSADLSREVQIDHRLPWSVAMKRRFMDRSTARAFYNDPRNLVVTTSELNRRKSDHRESGEGGLVVDADHEGRRARSIPRRDPRDGSLSVDSLPFGSFPPGPMDDDAWRGISLRRWDLLPGLLPEEEAKLAVRGVADGLVVADSNRIDVLRLLGNGVVPQMIAVAVRELLLRMAR